MQINIQIIKHKYFIPSQKIKFQKSKRSQPINCIHLTKDLPHQEE